MLYPARWKKIIVDQSKVLKNQLFRFYWATRYTEAQSSALAKTIPTFWIMIKGSNNFRIILMSTKYKTKPTRLIKSSNAKVGLWTLKWLLLSTHLHCSLKVTVTTLYFDDKCKFSSNIVCPIDQSLNGFKNHLISNILTPHLIRLTEKM